MLTLFFVLVASFFHAVAERLDGKGFFDSIFVDMKPAFFHRNGNILQPARPFNAWVLSNLCIAFFASVSIICYEPIAVPVVDLFIYVGAWVMNFEASYNLILRRKTR